MTYPGVVLAVILVVVVSSFIFNCFTEESPQANHKGGQNGHSTRDHVPVDNSWSTSSRNSTSPQRRRRKFSTYNCLICQEELDAVTQTLKCGHEFHFSCIENWLKLKRACPHCRRNM